MKKFVFLFLLSASLTTWAQKQPVKTEQPKHNHKPRLRPSLKHNNLA
jgi:hypothetical protein